MTSDRNHVAMAAAVTLAMVLAVPASAAEPAVADTAPPTASALKQTWIPKLRSGDANAYIELYGQINKGVLFFDDGEATDGYGPVDNANSSSRAGLRVYRAFSDGWSMGGNLEWEWTPYSTTYVNQLNRGDVDWDSNLMRKAEAYLTSERYGKLWLGQGSMASDLTAESDLSGTTVVGYSLVSDMAGGPFFRLEDGELSTVRVKDAFTNYDGLSRKLRVRYDTPSFAGFSLASSVGQQVVPTETHVTVWDIAARYDNDVGEFKIAAAIAYSQPAPHQNLYDGSISVLHDPSGISLTVSAAYSDRETIEGSYGYAKLGYRHDFFEVGRTAMSVDVFFGEDIAALGSESTSFGASFVQNLDYLQTELYLGLRSYAYEAPDQSFEDSVAILAGARMKF